VGLISEITSFIAGSGGKPEKRVADTEAAVAKLVSKKETARTVITALMRRRQASLLEDGTDKKIAEIDAEADRHRLVIERLEALEPRLINELQNLRSQARQARWRDLHTRWTLAARDYADAVRAAVKRRGVMVALSDEARAQGFEQEANSCFVAPMLVLTELALSEFERELDRLADAEALRAAPKPAPVTATPKPAPPAKPPRQRVAETPSEGEVVVAIVRNGVELPGRPPLAVGDLVAVKLDQAEKLMRSGAVDLHRGDAA